jgi:hypothetical protein
MCVTMQKIVASDSFLFFNSEFDDLIPFVDCKVLIGQDSLRVFRFFPLEIPIPPLNLIHSDPHEVLKQGQENCVLNHLRCPDT